MPEILFTNVRVFDGSGAPAYPGEVLVRGELIESVAPLSNTFDRTGRTVVDGHGHTLMPGLIDPHAHLTFPSSVDRIVLAENVPYAERALIAAHNARVTLDHGFTSIYSAGGRHGSIELALKKEIDGGFIPGPRMIASSSEIDRDDVPDDLTQLREFVRALAAKGYGSLKFGMSGFDGSSPGASRVATFSRDEANVIGEVGREAGVSLSCHAQANEAVKRAAAGGFRVFYHCTYADDEALDALESRRSDIFFAPAAGLPFRRIHASLEREKSPAEAQRFKKFSRCHLDETERVVREARRRGIRTLPGGDYGFAHLPIGQNAFDIQLFVEMFGYSPSEALFAATQLGGELMRLPVGNVKAGMFADLLLVQGDPTTDVSLLQNQSNLLVIMKGGQVYKESRFPRALPRS